MNLKDVSLHKIAGIKLFEPGVSPYPDATDHDDWKDGHTGWRFTASGILDTGPWM